MIFGRFLDDDDRPTFSEAPWALNQKLTVLPYSKVWTTGMLVAGEGPPDKRAGAPTSSKVIQVISQLEMQSLGPLHLTGLFILLS